MKRIFLPFIVLLLFANTVFSQVQEIPPLKEDKARVYFTRVTKYATYSMFYVFEEDSLLNINEGRNWFYHDCEKGEHLFWITNRKYADFMKAELEAGKSYIVMIDVKLGYGKTSVRFNPISFKSDVLPRAIQLISEEEPTHSIWEELFYKTKSLNKRGTIQEYLDNYYSDWVDSRSYFSLGDENIIPEKHFR